MQTCYSAMEDVDALPITEFANFLLLETSACIELILQLCAAIEYLSSQGLAPLDLKPENILVTASGRLKIADFGRTAPAGERAFEGDSIGVLLREMLGPACSPELDRSIARAASARSAAGFAQRLQRLL